MPLNNSTQHSSIYAYNGVSFDRLYMNSSNQLEVEVKNTSPLDVSGTFSADISGQYINISNFPTTQAVSASALPLPTNASTDTLQSAGNTLLTSIDSSITACNTSAVVISSGSVTETNSSDIETNTLAISSKLPSTLGKKTEANSLSVCLSSDLADVQMKVSDVVRFGSEENIVSNATLNAGSSSSSADVSNMRECNVVYNDTSTSSADGLTIECSGDDGTTFHDIGELYPINNAGNTKRVANVNINVAGFTDMRIVNKSSTDNYAAVRCSVYGAP